MFSRDVTKKRSEYIVGTISTSLGYFVLGYKIGIGRLYNMDQEVLSRIFFGIGATICIVSRMRDFLLKVCGIGTPFRTRREDIGCPVF